MGWEALISKDLDCSSKICSIFFEYNIILKLIREPRKCCYVIIIMEYTIMDTVIHIKLGRKYLRIKFCLMSCFCAFI